MNKLKGGPHEFHIMGADELITKHNSIMFEGCNTSFQMHLQVPPERFISEYNWAQAIAAPVLAAGGQLAAAAGEAALGRNPHRPFSAIGRHPACDRRSAGEGLADHLRAPMAAQIDHRDLSGRHRPLPGAGGGGY
ncbi:MAG: hypothetical protein H6628_04030 [Calditrichae bacterium]|nr:hypothetical protein [Calditrichia bacterium]